MKRLHIFLIKSFITPFISTFLIAIFLLLMQFLWKYIDDLVGKGLEINQIIQLLFYASARFVPLALPIAMLLSSLMVFGKLGENYELVALKASGISFFRILMPFLIFVSIISYTSFLFSNYIMPIANLKNASMIYDIQKKKPAFNIKEGIFYNDIEGFSLKIGEKDINGKNLKDIIIYDHSSGDGNNKVITAKRGHMELTYNDKFLELTLYDGYSYMDVKDKEISSAYRTTYFKEDLIRFDLSNFSIMKNSQHLYKGHYAMLNNKQLNKTIDSLENKIVEKHEKYYNNIKSKYNINIDHPNVNFNEKKNHLNLKTFDFTINKIKLLKSIIKNNLSDLKYKKIIIAKHKIEWHRKISLSIACLLLFLIGAPLGALIRKGGFGLPAVISVFFFLIYHVVSMIGEKAAKDLSMDPYQGMWLANFIFIPIAFILIYKASNDQKIIDFNIIKLSIFTNK